MKIDTNLDKGNWTDWEEGVSFRLRPYPITQFESVSDDFKSQISMTLKMFAYCIVDWKGLENDKGKPLPCDDVMKEYIFNHFQDIREFVMGAINKLMGVEDRESKN
jgi:hypothetical protein